MGSGRKPLKEIATLQNIYNFSYQSVIQKAKTVDVVWFNQRRFPYSFFEVEFTTDFRNSLLKFTELQDFYATFYIVSHRAREAEFRRRLEYDVFKTIQDRIKFVDYDDISNLHAKSYELYKVQKETAL